MFKIKRYLHEKAGAGEMTGTVLACDAFLECLFNGAESLDFVNHKADLLDEGDKRITSTSLPNIGKAIVAILQNFEATKNKTVWTSEVIWTQNEWLEIAKKLKPNIRGEVKKVQTSTVLKEGLDELRAGNFSMHVMAKIVKGTALAGAKYGGACDVTDNGLLGVDELTREDLKKLVAEKLA